MRGLELRRAGPDIALGFLDAVLATVVNDDALLARCVARMQRRETLLLELSAIMAPFNDSIARTQAWLAAKG